MPRTKWDVDRDIMKIIGSYSRGVCIKCKKQIAEGSQKVVNSYDICWDCYKYPADRDQDRLMWLVNELERKL